MENTNNANILDENTKRLDDLPVIKSIFGDEEKRKPKEGEYIGKDGYIYCSVCGKPKQSRAGGFLHPMMCQCRIDEIRREEEYFKRKAHERSVRDLLNDCYGINVKLKSNSFDTRDKGVNQDISRFCMDYCDNWLKMKKEGRSLIFCGGVGSGKTYLSSCICNELIEKYEERVKFVTENEFIEHYSGIKKRGEYLSSLLRYSLVVIDEMGAQTLRGDLSPTGYMSFLEDLINRRYNANKAVIITTNLNKTFFTQRNGDPLVMRVVSRLKEMALPPVSFYTKDIRQLKQKTSLGE